MKFDFFFSLFSSFLPFLSKGRSEAEKKEENKVRPFVLGRAFQNYRLKEGQQKRVSASEEKRQNRKSLPKELGASLLVLLAGFLFLLFVQHSFLSLLEVKSSLMMPTLQKGETLFLLKSKLLSLQYAQGDIVLLKAEGLSETVPYEHLLTRVVAGPFDKVEIKENTLFVNEQAIEETYLASDVKTSLERLKYQSLVLGENHYFVLGDVRENSLDSRYFGPVTYEQILGKILFK